MEKQYKKTKCKNKTCISYARGFQNNCCNYNFVEHCKKHINGGEKK